MINIVPCPSGKTEEYSGTCRIPPSIGVAMEDFEGWCLKAFLKRTEVTIDESAVWLKLVRNRKLDKEGYCLKIIEENITIEAACESGVIWALTTAVNLLEGDTLPCCMIVDTPKYPHRGLSLDCTRNYFAPGTVKKVIEQISLAKMNVLHWHLSDDQGWRIESKKFPLLHEISKEYYSQDEIKEIVDFARVRGVEIIPEIDLPGHTIGILAAYPQYSCSGKAVGLAESGGIYRTILCAGQEQTFEFIRQLLKEICTLFPSDRFHIGGDEAPKNEWAKCPHCQNRMKEQGIENLEDLQGYFVANVAKILEELGKQPIGWNDVLLAENAPKDIQIQYWSVNHAESMQSFAGKGGRFIYSDMFELYFDYPYSMTPIKKVYECIPHISKMECSEYSGFSGLEACIWCEHIKDSERLEQLLFPRIFAVAEGAWTGTGAADYEQFLQRLIPMAERTAKAGNACTPQYWWDPEGEARRKEAIDYFVGISSAMAPETREQTVESARPNKEFEQSFMTKFFRESDLPILLKLMTGE